jgi:hypothetical protein
MKWKKRKPTTFCCFLSLRHSLSDSRLGNPVCLHIDLKIVPSSKTSDQIEENSSGHKCPYYNIIGYDAKYSNTDLLERHVVQRHRGWTEYPGQPDLEKYKRELKEKGRFTND